MELAASHDRESKYWLEAVAEQERFKVGILFATITVAQVDLFTGFAREAC